MRTLSLKKETLVELSAGDLAGVVGGSGASCAQPCVSGVLACITRVCAPTIVRCIDPSIPC
jgi:hypothetical protein